MTASTEGSGPETPGVRPNEPAAPPTTSPGSGSGMSGGAPATGGTPIPPFSSQSASRAEAAADEAKAAASKAAGAARSAAKDIKDRARSAAATVADNVKESARSAASEQKNQAAERLSGFADALRTAASDLDQRGQSVASGFVRQAAEGLEHVSGAVRTHDLDDLVETVESFARRQPVVFLGSAVLAGFGLARFIKSSAERRRERGYGYDPDRPYDPERRAQEARPGDPGTPYAGTPYEGGL
jgi:vacuolar-type H+-ATPase subunit E/Vma4